MLEGGGAGCGDVLPASVDVGLDHDTGDVAFASGELRADVINNKGLVVVVLLGVAVCCRVQMRIPRK